LNFGNKLPQTNGSFATIRDVPPGELTNCLQWLLPHVTVARASWIVAQLTARVQRQRVSDILAVEQSCNEIVIAAGIAMVQPASSATLLAIQDEDLPDSRTESPLMDNLVGRMRSLGVRFVQASSDSADEQLTLGRNGFTKIADLVFLVLEADVFGRLDPIGDRDDVVFETVGDNTEAMGIVCDVAARSFLETADCPRLSLFRSPEEIVEGYRMSLNFDPTLWRIVRSKGEVVGCLLLAVHPPEGAVEISYMGLVPQWRRRGLGRSILRHAYAIANARRAPRMVLAVDRENLPAVELYRRQGWSEAAGETVWGLRIST